ncbi:15769_t:CDS:2, partial [Acaulospora morrowiae]
IGRHEPEKVPKRYGIRILKLELVDVCGTGRNKSSPSSHLLAAACKQVVIQIQSKWREDIASASTSFFCEGDRLIFRELIERRVRSSFPHNWGIAVFSPIKACMRSDLKERHLELNNHKLSPLPNDIAVHG